MDFDLNAGIAILERTPRTFRVMLEGLSSAWTDSTEGPDTWSPYIIVGHLIHGERADWIPRARIILAQGEDTRFTHSIDSLSSAKAKENRSLSCWTSLPACVPRISSP